jgi:hypothetical protein
MTSNVFQLPYELYQNTNIAYRTNFIIMKLLCYGNGEGPIPENNNTSHKISKTKSLR